MGRILFTPHCFKIKLLIWQHGVKILFSGVINNLYPRAYPSLPLSLSPSEVVRLCSYKLESFESHLHHFFLATNCSTLWQLVVLVAPNRTTQHLVLPVGLSVSIRLSIEWHCWDGVAVTSTCISPAIMPHFGCILCYMSMIKSWVSPLKFRLLWWYFHQRNFYEAIHILVLSLFFADVFSDALPLL